MIFKNSKVYDVLKWCVLVLTDALITLITTLGGLYHFDSAIIVGTIAAISTFVGALLGISSAAYKKVQNADNTFTDGNGVSEIITKEDIK